jgi:hypothetical protein
MMIRTGGTVRVPLVYRYMTAFGAAEKDREDFEEIDRVSYRIHKLALVPIVLAVYWFYTHCT